MAEVPEAVRRQMEEADRLQAEQDKAAAGGANPAPTPDTPVNDVSTPDDNTAPQSTPEATTTTTETAGQEQVAQPGEDPGEVNRLKAELEKWKHKYETINGKYIAEGERLRDEIRQIREDIGRMKPSDPAPPPAEAPAHAKADISKYFSPKDIEEYGEDFLRKQAEIAMRIAEEQVAPLKRELESERKRMSDTEFKTFESSVRGAIPDYDRINTSPEFVDWLGKTPDGFSGRTLYDSLNDAGVKRDLNRVKAIFGAFTAQKAPPQSAPAKAPADLNRQIAPPKQGVSAPATGGKKMYTMAEIREVHANITKGRYTMDDARRIQNEIDQALIEGRVRG